MRCFLCIEIKKPVIITKILQFQDEFKPIDARIKFVEAENLHFTLKFLGNIEPTIIDEIYSTMKKVPFSAFPINFETVGSFPASRPRVIWIGISEGRDELSSITTYLNQNLKNLGFKPEKRKFSPHITIGRVKYVNDKKSLMSLLQKWQNQSFGKMNVTSFQLKKSVLTPKGPIYTILKEIEG
ncbi:MAG: RNA 2',3'-cyclic phosphodiesterase [Candidatus Helarchaeota archaeon]|nr:RNA 2',3'-cyclic phosphodiesterase [Candidatus Helarchaeota archaeon]